MKISHTGLLALATVIAQGAAQSTTLLRNATIATWNDASMSMEIYMEASLLVKGDEISQIFKKSDSTPKSVGQVIDATGKIIVPGFVSTHQHVWQTIYKTLAPDIPFAAYFPRLGHMAKISSTLSVDDIYRSELMGGLELLSEGTTTWVDITSVLSPESVEAAWKASVACGGRSYFGATLQARPDFTEDAQLTQMSSLASRKESLVTLGLSYDGFEIATADSMSKVLELVKSGKVKFITTHFVGGPFGNSNSPTLLNSPQWALLNGTLPILFSHASEITPLDASLLRQTNQYVSIAPESELHFGHGNPHAHLIQDQAALAADSVVGFSTSLIWQARMWLQQVRGRLSQLEVEEWRINTNIPMTVKQGFYLATRGGALALRRPDLGIIAQGAKADLVVYDTSKPHLLGWRDPITAIMLYSNPGDISDVMVAGKFVKKDFKMVFKGFDQLRKDFDISARAFADRYYNYDFGELPHWFGLAEYSKAMEVDVVRGNATGY